MQPGPFWGLGIVVNSHRELPRDCAPSPRPGGCARFAVLALTAATLTAAASCALAQGMSENQVRCMQLQQDLIAAQHGGGGGDRSELPRIDQQIAQADRVFQGTRAEMENARCFESFFIFGRGLVRSPKCLAMNGRVEDARRQLTQLQQQRQAIVGGGGNKRQQAELHAALARAGCGPAAQKPRRGGLLDFFGGGQEPEPQPEFQTPVYRSIDPNGRYKTVCVRLCDGFFYPISYSTYGARVGADAERCQSNCAAPAELYVHPVGREIEQAISLQGSAYMDLPVALKYRKDYVKGCSCKQAEYNPAEIEAANKRAAADAAAPPPPKGGAKKPPAQAAAPAAPETPPAPQAAVPAGEPPSLQIDITGATLPASAGGAPGVPPLPAAEQAAEEPLAPPAPADEAPAPTGSTIAKGRSSAPATPQ
jgi:hypothetical protein